MGSAVNTLQETHLETTPTVSVSTDGHFFVLLAPCCDLWGELGQCSQRGEGSASCRMCHRFLMFITKVCDSSGAAYKQPPGLWAAVTYVTVF